MALLSKFGGGIGWDWSKVRAMGGSIDGHKNAAGGIIPFLKITNDIAVAVDQLGTRKGAIAVYIEPWHMDISDFIDLRKNYDESKLYLNNGANIEVTGNGNATASAVGIYSLTGAELSATDKVTLNVKDAKVNNGIIVGSTDNSKENLHLKDLEATVSGGEESYGMQAHGGVAVLENANITVKDGTVKNAGIWTWSKDGINTGKAKLGNGIITVEGGNAAYGLIAQQKSSIETNGIVTITAQNAAKNYGVNANGGTIETNGANTTITAQNGDSAYGVYIVDGVFNSKNTLNVYASNATNSNYGIYAYAGKVNVDDVTVITTGDKTTYGIVARDYNNVASEIT